MSTIKPARSGIDASNLDEVLKASQSTKTALQGGQQQYETPAWMAEACATLLPTFYPAAALDPQCAGGNLLKDLYGRKYGMEIDKRFSEVEDGVSRVTGNCVDTIRTLQELYPEKRFDCLVANPPFGLRLKVGDGVNEDSTAYTWRKIMEISSEHAMGYFIANWKTIERLKIHQHPAAYLYQRVPVGVWSQCEVEIGIVHWLKGREHNLTTVIYSTIEEARLKMATAINPPNRWGYSESNLITSDEWTQLQTVVAEERGRQPEWNISIDREGMLRTYLSTRAKVKIKQSEVMKLVRIENCHPLTLTTEKETRVLMQELIESGAYKIQPAAKRAIAAALAEVKSLGAPIRHVTNFELVAYADEEEKLVCKTVHPAMALTVGKSYDVLTGTYTFVEKFKRKKIHYNEETEETTVAEHCCALSGEDRFIAIRDDGGMVFRFMDRPEKPTDYPEILLWQLFKEPNVTTIADLNPEQYEANLATMDLTQTLAGFTFYPGQRDYYARIGCKNYALVAADVGTGKTLGALTLVALKNPRRTLIIAPQGTMRSSGDKDSDEDDAEYSPSQWVQEIERFAPTEPVFQLFGKNDYYNILAANGGELPPGIYISYPQAMFHNDSFEHLPDSWGSEEWKDQSSDYQIAEKKFCTKFDLPYSANRLQENCYSAGIGKRHGGIRCIGKASLSSLIGEVWDMVIVDEAHLMCNPDAHVTESLLLMQPKYRFAMTATPIPNVVTNLFTLMGWLCVPDWYKGERRNAAWPYAVNESTRFEETFLAYETDLTQQSMNKANGMKSWKNSAMKTSPIISSPARLLKLLKPTLAYISKEECNPSLVPCEVIDVRVPMGEDQNKLYGHYLNRGVFLTKYKNPLVAARVQTSKLRGICAAPAEESTAPYICGSNMNGKTWAIMALICASLERGEQAVFISARVNQTNTIERLLVDAGIPIARIDRTVKSALHAAESQRFKRGDARVMLMGIKCAVGHSYPACPNLIIGSLEWSFGSLHQGKGRVHRLNSLFPVKIYCVLHSNSIEEMLFDRVALKADAATLCLHGRRLPRDFKTMDASEVLAEHMLSFKVTDSTVQSEVEAEIKWPELRAKLSAALITPHRKAA
jgi:hypothetical protein